MDSSPEGHSAGRPSAGRFAVVAYIPDPLGSFLEDLRLELSSGPGLRPHFTILPPRSLSASPETLQAELGRLARSLPPLDVTLGEIEAFPASRVIYLTLASGRQAVEQWHVHFNHGPLFVPGSQPFLPHVAVAADRGRSPFENLLALARRRWRECPLPRSFTIEQLVLVQSRQPDLWEDVSRQPLAPLTLLRTA